MKRNIFFALLALLPMACGIKPDNVDPPPEAKSGEFPRTYPDIATDPPPYIPPPRN